MRVSVNQPSDPALRTTNKPHPQSPAQLIMLGLLGAASVVSAATCDRGTGSSLKGPRYQEISNWCKAARSKKFSYTGEGTYYDCTMHSNGDFPRCESSLANIFQECGSYQHGWWEHTKDGVWEKYDCQSYLPEEEGCWKNKLLC